MSENKKKIVIVGGGIAGLSAGIYGKLAGYDVDIYEKNPIAGGQCMGWNRKGCGRIWKERRQSFSNCLRKTKRR